MSVKPIGGIKPKRVGAFLTRVFTVMLAAVMAVSLGSFASDALDALDAGGTFGTRAQNAYAATRATPYENLDVPLSANADDANGANSNNGDNTNPNRVETDDGTQTENAPSAGILGPTLASVSGRTSDDTSTEAPDGGSYTDAYTEGAYAYERIKGDNDEDTGKVRLVKVDPAIGKVVRIEANVSEIAPGAFTECDDLQTLIVFGDVKSIAKAERDADGNLTQEGAFTDDQLKNVHIVFATTYLDDASLHATRHADSSTGLDEGMAAEKGDGDESANGDAVAEDGLIDEPDANANDGNGMDAGNSTDSPAGEDAGEPTTPVDEGIKRLSGDVVLSAPITKDDDNNVWLQTSFENIVDTPQIGAKGTAIENVSGDDPIDDEADNQIGENVDADSESGGSQSHGLIYTLLPDYTLEVAWNGDGDMPVDLALPDYGRVDGTIYETSKPNSDFQDGKGDASMGENLPAAASDDTAQIAIEPQAIEPDSGKNFITADKLIGDETPIIDRAVSLSDDSATSSDGSESHDPNKEEAQDNKLGPFRTTYAYTLTWSQTVPLNGSSVTINNFTSNFGDPEISGHTTSVSSYRVEGECLYVGSLGWIQAHAPDGYYFAYWTTHANDNPDQNILGTQTYQLTANTTVTACFKLNNSFSWGGIAAGSGTVSINNNIACTPGMTLTMNVGFRPNGNQLNFLDKQGQQSGYLQATPADGYYFAYWSPNKEGSTYYSYGTNYFPTGGTVLYAVFKLESTATFTLKSVNCTFSTVDGPLSYGYGPGDNSTEWSFMFGTYIYGNNGTPVYSRNSSDPSKLYFHIPGTSLYGHIQAVANSGYTFKGWSTDADGSSIIGTDEVSLTSSKTLYAVATKNASVTLSGVNATFSGDAAFGGGVISNTSSWSGTSTSGSNKAYYKGNGTKLFLSMDGASYAGTITATPKDGYTFIGWSTSASGSTLISTEDTYITKDITLYAVALKTFSLTLSTVNESGDAIGSFSVYRNGSGTIVSSVPTYTFLGISTYTTYVSSYPNGLSFRGDESGYINRPSASGYTFMGWSTQKQGNAFNTANLLKENTTFTLTGNTTLYAIYKKNANLTITTVMDGVVQGTWQQYTNGTMQPTNTYSSSEYDGFKIDRSSSGGNAYISAPYPVTSMTPRTGGTMMGWATTEGGSALADGDYIIAGDTTMYAVFSYPITFTTVYGDKTLGTFEYYSSSGMSNGATCTANGPRVTISTAYGANTIMSPGLIRFVTSNNDAEFIGWSFSNKGTDILSNGTYAVTSATTVYAVFRFTATYDPNGGTGTVRTSTWNSGASFAMQSYIFTRTGYWQSGWATTANGDQVYPALGTSYSGLYENIHLYAFWRANVTYKWAVIGSGTITEGGTAAGSSKTVSNTGIRIQDNVLQFYTAQNYASGALTPKAGSNYYFSHWSTKADGSNQISTTQVSYYSGDVTLYAVFRPTNTYSWSVIGEGTLAAGGMPPTTTVVSNAGVKLESSGNLGFYMSTLQALTVVTPTPKTNYHFSHWTTNADGSGKFTADSITFHEGSTALYAVFLPNTITVTTSSGAGISATSISASGSTVNNGTATVNYNTSVTIDATVKAGYTWKNWTGSATTATKRYTFTAGSSNVSFTANATPNTDTPYIVEHYQMTTSGTYPASPTETESKKGTTDTSVTAAAKAYTGFSYDASNASNVASGMVAGDGSLVLKIYYKRNSYTVTLTAPNGSGTNAASCTASNGWTRSSDGKSLTKSYMYGTTLGTLPFATRSGYTFVGWRDGNLGGTSTAPSCISNTTTVSGEKTYYAVWSFSVRYSATNRTTGTLPSATTYYTGSSGSAVHAVTTNTFTRTHYDWHGWTYTDITGSTSAPTTYSGSITVTPNDDANKCRWLYATWKFYVGYNGNNDAVSGTVPADVTLYVGSAGSAAYTTQSPSLTQRGYVFGRNAAGAEEADYTDTLTVSYPNKWNTRADSSGTYYTGAQSMMLSPTTSNTDSTGKKVVLYGQWTLINYDITYNLNGGTAENNRATYNVRTPDFTLNKPVRPGYDFSPGSDANGPYTISTCGWTGNYNATAKEGQSGYSMARTDSLTIKQGSIGQITLTANWHLHEYAISYSLNGGTLPSLQRNPSTYNVETASFTLVNPEKYPYSFQGWTVTGADTENGAAIDTQGVQTTIRKGTIGTLVCTAAWESFRYNINYDGNGETGGATSATAAEYGKSWTAAANGFTRAGFEFDSWNTQANGRGQRYEAGKTYSDNLVSERGTNATLFAIWKANPYTVRFNANYDGATASPYTQEMYCGEARELTPSRFTRPGYVFAGWSEIEGVQGVKYADAQKVVDLETVAGNTHDLYAQWTPITYTVNFYANNSDASGATNPQTLTYDVPEALHGCGYIVQGYRFDGWNTASDGSGMAYKDYEMVKNLTTRTDLPINLYAQWSPVRYTVTYVKNEANVEGEDRQTSEHVWDEWKSLTSIADLGWTWTGHHFDGWYLSQNGSGISYQDAESVQKLTERDGDNIQLFAQWSPDIHRVTLDACGGTYVQGATHDPRWVPISGGASAYRDIEYGDMYASDLGLPMFSRPGYDFAGWWTTAEPTEADPGTQIAAGGNHTFLGLSDQVLYVRWTPIKYKYQLAIETADGGTRYLSDAQEVGFEDGLYLPGRDDQVGIGETQELKRFAKQGYLIVGWSLNRASETAEYALGSTQSGLTTEADKVVVVWAIQKLGDYYVTYYKDVDYQGEDKSEVFLTETIRKDQTYFITSATVDRAGYTQTHWEIPSAGHIKYTPGSYIQSNNILTGQFELGDEIAVIPVWQKVQITVQFSDSIGTKVPSNFQIGYEDRVTRLNRNQFNTTEGDFTFEGYWTEPSGNGIMLYDATGKPAGPNSNEDGVWRYPPDEGTSLVTLYAKWTCPVTFEFPYGGGTRATHNFIAYTSYSDKANAKNLDHLKEDANGNLEDANYVDDSWYSEWVNGLFNPTHALDSSHEWAGWYTKPEFGRQVRVSAEVEDPTTLYGCWKVYAKFNYWDDPTYSSGWVLRGNNLERVEDEEGGAITYRQQLIQGQTYQTAGLLPSAARAGYMTEADCWFDDPEGGLVFRTPGVAPAYDEAYRISSGDVMRHEDDFDVYLEYSLGRANIKVERYLQDIGGMDYTYVEGADSMDVLGTELLVDDTPYRNDAPSSDYEGFTYDFFDVDSTDPSLQNAEGRVAGDGTTVVRLYYARHTFDLTLEDFWVTDAAGVDNVRGAGAAQGTYPRPDIEVEYAESDSFGALSGVQTGASNVMEVWYGQTIELSAVADAGYAFDEWQATDGEDAGHAGIINGQSALTGDEVAVSVKAAQGGADADASAQSDIPTHTFVVRDSAPHALAKFVAQDVPYAVEAYFEGLTDASTSTGTFTRDYSNVRGADMDDLVAKTDSMTKVIAPGHDASDGEVALHEVAGFDVAWIEVGSESSEGQSGAIVPATLKSATDAKEAVDEDPSTFEDAEEWVENGLVKGDGTTVVRVFYKRCAYAFEVSGSTWADATGASGTAPARLALYDDATHGYIEAMSEDAEDAPGRNTYAAFYEADVSVAARAVGYAELMGYVSDVDGIAIGDHGEVYGYDSESLLDGSLAVPEDTDGLPQWDDTRYVESMYGFAAKRMPASDVSVTVQAQPVRTTYISRYLFQDADPESEVEPASTYTLNRSTEMDADASYEIEVTRTSDDARLLRYWIDGTDAEAHALDGTDSSADATAQRGDLEVPPTGFEPSTAADAITSLARLTPEGNEVVDGKPANVTYSKYDRKRHDVTYAYAGGPNEAANQRPDGVDAPETVGSYYGATVRIADTPQVDGWAFDGWMWMQDPDTDRDGFPYVGQGTDSESVTVPDFDVSVTGTWSAIPYTLTYDGGTAEGTPKSPMSPTGDTFGENTVLFDSEWRVSGTVPNRGGYTFIGWTFAERAVFEAIVSGPIDLAAGDVDGYRTALAAMSDLDGNPLILEPGQSQVWSWHKGDRTLHAVWMRNSYDVTFDLGQGGWPTGTTVPLTYMTGAEVKVPQPVRDGYAFVGWDVTCDGSALDGDAPAVSYTDDDPTRATINEWAYGNVTFTAKYDVMRYAVNLNPAGGTFDGEPEGFMDKDIEYSSPNEDGAYGQATVYIPYRTEITSTTTLPEPTRPGYDFAGWTDTEGNRVGWMLDDDGNRVDVPYTFDGAREETWVATWRAHRYKVTYDLGDYADAVTINDADRFSEYYAGMVDTSGNVVTSFMLPTASDLSGIPENVSFDGWYLQGDEPEDLMRSFDPNATTGDKAFVARFSIGANSYTERFWLEVLDQAEDVEGRQYAFIGDVKFALDETLSVTRRTNSPNAQASMSAITGFKSVNPYDGNGVSIYPTEHPYVCVFSAGQSTVNGFYTREARNLTVGTANGVADGETLIQVSPASALVRDADAVDGSYAVDADANTATLKGASIATVKWGATVNVGVTCPRETGYAFVAWQTDAGATPADIDVRKNPATFTMPDADVALVPSTELIHFTATYKDAFGKDVPGAGQATFTVLDGFALANLDDVAGYRFERWDAFVADESGNKLDPETNPVPATVGYDDAQEYMRVREGTATDLLFEARYEAFEYTVSVTLPKGTAYLPSGMPDGLPEIDGVEWVLMPGDGGTDVIGFNYTIEDLSEPLVVDLTGISCAPYRVNAWNVTGMGGESNVPELSDGVLALAKDNLGDWSLTPDVSPIRYIFTLDPTDVRDGYVPLDIDEVRAELEAAGYEVRDGDKPGTLDVTFDVETAGSYTLPSFMQEDGDSTPEHAFRGWAKDGDAANALSPYILPPADIAGWPETGTVIAPVWAKSGEQSTLVAHLPNDEGEYADDYTFTFTGDALTPIDYAQDGRFLDIVNDVGGTNVGYHLVWHGTSSLTDDDVTTLPANFPEQGTVEVWGEWVEDDDIITVGFGVKWDNSAPPGETKPRFVLALNSADVVNGAAAIAAYSGDEAGTASTLPMRSAYADDAAAMGGAATDDADGDAVETPIADANSTYCYIPNRGLYTKDANGKYHIVTRIANINDIAGSYAGWRLEGFYLPIDTADPKRIIIGPDGTVDNATFVEVAGSKPSDLTFTVRWARISLVEVNMTGGYGEGSDDFTFLYWPEKDVFVRGDDGAIGDQYSAPRTYAKDDFNTGVMLGTFATKGIPEAKEGVYGTRAFVGYFGETSNGRWDYAKDAEGNPLPAADALTLTASFSYLAITGDYDKQATVGTGTVTLLYGYDTSDDAQAYDPASADGATCITWRAAWEGDLDAVYFNATVPMSMSFMVRADGTAIGPEAGAYQIKNYSNTAISVEDMSFEWADESELEALFGKGATDALALSATPTNGQDGYAQTKVLLERSKATQDAVGAGLVSRYVFGADKWVIAKSVGIDPDDFTGDASMLPALRLDYGLTAGGIRQLTQENASQDTTHPIGTLKFTLKTVR